MHFANTEKHSPYLKEEKKKSENHQHVTQIKMSTYLYVGFAHNCTEQFLPSLYLLDVYLWLQVTRKGKSHFDFQSLGDLAK